MKTASKIYDHEVKSKSISNEHKFSSDREEKQFKFKSCDSGYKQKQRLDLHVVSFHEGKKLFNVKFVKVAFYKRQD